MSVDPRTLRDLAQGTGFRPETLEKIIRLGEIAGDVARHPLLSRVLVLKGGTAINLCFGEPRRLSVDLDFNYIGNIDKAAMEVERPEVNRALRIIAQGREYRMQQSADQHGGGKIYLGYRSAAGTPDRVEIDVNYLYRLSLGEPQALRLWQPPTVERPVVSVVGPEELTSGKLVAFFDRAAPRDAYDVSQLPSLRIPGWMSPRMRQIFLAMSTVLPHPIHSYGRERLSRLAAPRVEAELAPMLARAGKIDAAQLAEQAWSTVESLVELSPNEKEFVDLANQGDLEPSLIADDDATFASSLARHPAILWKIDNARRHRRRPD